jgi:hypothetical protein
VKQILRTLQVVGQSFPVCYPLTKLSVIRHEPDNVFWNAHAEFMQSVRAGLRLDENHRWAALAAPPRRRTGRLDRDFTAAAYDLIRLRTPRARPA